MNLQGIYISANYLTNNPMLLRAVSRLPCLRHSINRVQRQLSGSTIVFRSHQLKMSTLAPPPVKDAGTSAHDVSSLAAPVVADHAQAPTSPVVADEEVLAPMSDELRSKVLKQLEFYFSDPNLNRDRFMREMIGANDGFVDFDTFMKFNLIKNLVSDVRLLPEACHTSNVLSVSEDKSKVKRIIPYSGTSAEDAPLRSLFIGGIHEAATLKECQDAFSALVADPSLVAYVKMRREAKKFTGTLFVEFANVETATAVLEKASEIMIKDQVVEDVQMMSTWMESNKSEQKKGKVGFKEHQVEIIRGVLVSFESVGPDCSRELLKEACGFPDQVAYVDFSKGETSGKLRFRDAESAKACIEVFSTADCGGAVPTNVVLLEGEAEDEYWKSYEARKADFAKNKNNKRGRNDHRGDSNKRNRR